MRNIIRRFLADESGATAIEYGLLASLIAVAIITGAVLLGTNINQLFTDIANCLSTGDCDFGGAGGGGGAGG